MPRFALFLLTLFVIPTAAQAQACPNSAAPAFKLEDTGGQVLLLVCDDGTLQVPTGATSGYVLTTDADGNASWQPAPSGGGGGGLTLPFEGTHSGGGDAFEVSVNTASAQSAGVFTNLSTTNADPALVARTVRGGAPALHVEGSGGATSTAATFEGAVTISDAGGGLTVTGAAQDGLTVEGAGRHAAFLAGDGSGGLNTATLYAKNTSSGRGVAGLFEVEGTNAALVAAHHGTGPLLSGFVGGQLKARLTNDGTLFLDGELNCTACVGNADLKSNSIRAGKLFNGPGGKGSSGIHNLQPLRDQSVVLRSVTLNAPSAGTLLAWATVGFNTSDDNGSVLACGLTTDTSIDLNSTADYFKYNYADVESGESKVIPLTKALTVSSAGAFTVNLVCMEKIDDVWIDRSDMTTLFVPTSY